MHVEKLISLAEMVASFFRRISLSIHLKNTIMPRGKEKGGSQGSGRSNQGENKGGRTSERGLAAADKETRERVAREGGKASQGGGRSSERGGGGSEER
jgi:hypothetical protein